MGSRENYIETALPYNTFKIASEVSKEDMLRINKIAAKQLGVKDMQYFDLK